VINGLHFDITSQELAEHLQIRLLHHQERSAFYRQQAATLESGGAEAAKYTNGDPVRSLRTKEDEHIRKSQLFDFMVRHVVKNETYRLSESDLISIEFVSRCNW